MSNWWAKDDTRDPKESRDEGPKNKNNKTKQKGTKTKTKIRTWGDAADVIRHSGSCYYTCGIVGTVSYRRLVGFSYRAAHIDYTERAVVFLSNIQLKYSGDCCCLL